MPHVPYRARPLPGGVERPTPPERNIAPLSDPQAALEYLPEVEVDILDLPMDSAPAQTEKPEVPFAAPRRRERDPSKALLPRISAKNYSLPQETIEKHLFPDQK